MYDALTIPMMHCLSLLTKSIWFSAAARWINYQKAMPKNVIGLLYIVCAAT